MATASSPMSVEAGTVVLIVFGEELVGPDNRTIPATYDDRSGAFLEQVWERARVEHTDSRSVVALEVLHLERDLGTTTALERVFDHVTTHAEHIAFGNEVDIADLARLVEILAVLTQSGSEQCHPDRKDQRTTTHAQQSPVLMLGCHAVAMV